MKATRIPKKPRAKYSDIKPDARYRLAKRAAKRDLDGVRHAGETTVKVACSGRLHRITYRPYGQLTFHDHTREELEAMRVFDGMGDDQCGCLNAAGWNRGDRWYGYRGELTPTVRAAWQARTSRESAKIYYRHRAKFVSVRDRDRQGWMWSVAERMRYAASNIGHYTAYPGGFFYIAEQGDSMGTGTNLVLGPATNTERPGVESHCQARYTQAAGWKSSELIVTAKLPAQWLSLFTGGLGLVNGLIVVEMDTATMCGRAAVLTHRRENFFRPAVEMARVRLRKLGVDLPGIGTVIRRRYFISEVLDDVPTTISTTKWAETALVRER